MDIALTSGGLREKAACVKVVQPHKKGYALCQFVRSNQVQLHAKVDPLCSFVKD
jgi:hypothetical protein